MFNRDKWNEVIESLSSNIFRTVLTAFGVFWGIFILVLLLAAGNGLENGVKGIFSGISTNSMFMWTQTASRPYDGLPKGRRYNFDVNDITAIEQKVNGLKYVSPRNQLGGFGGSNNVVRGLKNGDFYVSGDYPEILNQESLKILRGRFINQNDIENKRKVAVIGEGVLNELYEIDEDPLGTYIKVNSVNFMVIGVYKKRGFGGGDAEEEQKKVYTPFTAFSQAFNYGEVVGWIAITAEDDFSITSLKEQIFSIIKTNHRIHPEDDRAIGNFDLYEQFSKIQGLFIALNAVAYFVGILILLSGVIGISNIMLIVVKERTNEIGVRRALGATPWEIRGQILFESVFLTIIAGMAGIVFATGILGLINQFLPKDSDIPFVNPSVDLQTVIIALTILIITGLLAGFIPAQNAIKVKPVDALRTE
ncbi:macrolide efflux ABC-type transporter, permease protein MacB_PCD superfamily [Psychroflexus torquis ATCC 700755]|uniref:Macrolide efflux ABC-type transporter, permease protein MacB_PCD superfamily n=1 Tax=Psychroflexus torquis (strain ATCC 700755 / CIP 106069 / ACAM 623) TaxID=313595 RepID=K4IT34_PSYTT|nr:ABC transporter permease [Psychroflexus torquis]AFU68635.1 macrolide efflux ABC-type transporter, permease protein MacB_PCD superfamily [Psychroflexus torquis ATCC 700755]